MFAAGPPKATEEQAAKADAAQLDDKGTLVVSDTGVSDNRPDKRPDSESHPPAKLGGYVAQ